MIVIDTSAMIAIAVGELIAPAVLAAIAEGGELVMSAGTLAETLIVARRRGVGALTAATIDRLRIEIVSVDRAGAELVADAYDRWGKGVHPAALGYGDCFAYALAKERGCPLLFVGNDFSQTDIMSALRP